MEHAGRPSQRGPWRPSDALAAASTPTSATPRRRGTPANIPMAFEPPPTQATTRVGQPPLGLEHLLARLSAPITDWSSRTISGYGAGPTAEPMT